MKHFSFFGYWVRTAEALGIDKSTPWRKLRHHAANNC
jgi:transcriptional regulator of acetoin/glycerol metabolism